MSEDEDDEDDVEEGLLINYELQFSTSPDSTFSGRIVLEIDDEDKKVFFGTSSVPNMLMPYMADILVSIAPIKDRGWPNSKPITGIAVRRLVESEDESSSDSSSDDDSSSDSSSNSDTSSKSLGSSESGSTSDDDSSSGSTSDDDSSSDTSDSETSSGSSESGSTSDDESSSGSTLDDDSSSESSSDDDSDLGSDWVVDETRFIGLAQIPEIGKQGYDRLRAVADSLSLSIVAELDVSNCRDDDDDEEMHHLEVELDIRNKSDEGTTKPTASVVDDAKDKILNFKLTLQDGLCCVLKLMPDESSAHLLNYSPCTDPKGCKNEAQLYLVDASHLTVTLDSEVHTLMFGESKGIVQDVLFQISSEHQLLQESKWFEFLDISRSSKIREMHVLFYSDGDLVDVPKHYPFTVCAKWRIMVEGAQMDVGSHCMDNVYESASVLIGSGEGATGDDEQSTGDDEQSTGNDVVTLDELNSMTARQRAQLRALDEAGILALEKEWMRTLRTDIKALKIKFPENKRMDEEMNTRWQLHYAHRDGLEAHIKELGIQLAAQSKNVEVDKLKERANLDLLNSLKPMLEESMRQATDHAERVKKFEKVEVADRKQRRMDLLELIRVKSQDAYNLKTRIESEKTVLHTTKSAVSQLRAAEDVTE